LRLARKHGARLGRCSSGRVEDKVGLSRPGAFIASIARLPTIEQREASSDPASCALVKLPWVSHIDCPERLGPSPHKAGSQFDRQRVLTLARLTFDVGISHILNQFSVFSFQFSVMKESPLAEN
jgi:hypothetical protein